MGAQRRARKHELRVVEYKHHPTLKWTVAGDYVDGKRRRRFFPTKAKAQAYANREKIRRQNLGVQAARIPVELHVEAVDASERLAPWGRSLRDAVDFYIKHLETTQSSCPVAELLPDFLKAKEADGAGERYLRDLRTRLGRFSRDFGDTLVSEISTGDLDEWLRDLGLSPQSRINFRRVLSVFFEFARKGGRIETNPVADTSQPRRVETPPEIFTPGQARALLDAAAAHCPEIVPYLAIGLFGGLRVAELERLEWKHVRFERGHIEVTGAISKTASRRLVKIEPNLATWLRPHVREAGPVTPDGLRMKREIARKVAGIDPWPDNGMRHSFGSYHLAHFRDAARTALEMGHTNTAMLFRHYRELVTPEDSEVYWGITAEAPRNVVFIRATG